MIIIPPTIVTPHEYPVVGRPVPAEPPEPSEPAESQDVVYVQTDGTLVTEEIARFRARDWAWWSEYVRVNFVDVARFDADHRQWFGQAADIYAGRLWYQAECRAHAQNTDAERRRLATERLDVERQIARDRCPTANPTEYELAPHLSDVLIRLMTTGQRRRLLYEFDLDDSCGGRFRCVSLLVAAGHLDHVDTPRRCREILSPRIEGTRLPHAAAADAICRLGVYPEHLLDLNDQSLFTRICCAIHCASHETLAALLRRGHIPTGGIEDEYYADAKRAQHTQDYGALRHALALAVPATRDTLDFVANYWRQQHA